MAYERDEVRDSAVEWIGVVLRHHRDQDNPVLKHTRALLDQPTWWWLYDKPLEVAHWSTGAIESYRRNGKVVTNVGQRDSLVREHVVPRKVIIDLLLALPHPTPEAIRNIFDRYHVVAIVTREEHARLSDEVDLDNLWHRYKDAGIEIVGPPGRS